MLNMQTPCQILKQAKHLRRIARLISRNSLGPGPAGLNSLQDRLIQVYPEVAEAIVSKRPVVALESTIITHGMPYPENLRYVVDIQSYSYQAECIQGLNVILSAQVIVAFSVSSSQVDVELVCKTLV